MPKILSVNLTIREDIDSDLYKAISEIPKGKGRSEYIRKLLSQTKIPRKQKDDAHMQALQNGQNQQGKTVEKGTPPVAAVAPQPRLPSRQNRQFNRAVLKMTLWLVWVAYQSDEKNNDGV